MINEINQPKLLKLGKKHHRKDHRDLMFKDYIDRSVLPPISPLPICHADLITNWGMLANDRLGDCVIAGSCHSVMLYNAEAGRPVTFTDQNAISVYSAACG